MRYTFQRLALILFGIYLAVLPGSTIVVALDRVPAWGAGMGSALLLLQGAAALCWLVGRYGARGGLTALLVFLMAWAVEHAGVTTGVPFGRYYYTSALQPQFFGTVPLAIPCAWLMVAAGAWQLATTKNQELENKEPRTKNKEQRAKSNQQPRTKSQDPGNWAAGNLQSAICNLLVAATLVLLLDLQIETIATRINQYWIWLDGGPYYGVPTANFVAWWLTGLAMALVVATLLGRQRGKEARRQGDKETRSYAVRLMSYVLRRLPAYLYLLSTLMFTSVNLARGYTVAGLVGVLVLLVVFSKQRCILTRRRGDAEIGRWGEAS